MIDLSTLRTTGLALPPRDCSIVVTGSRAASPYGTHVAGELAFALVEEGFSIVSGFAFGIDTAAHRGALAAGGHTTAVLASGLDIVYPRANHQLAHTIREQGTLASLCEDGAAPTRQRFLERNHLMVELASAVIIVEAALRSSSLETARYAFEIGVPVFAVPGPITSATSAGTHDLLKKTRARICTAADDVWPLVKANKAMAAEARA